MTTLKGGTNYLLFTDEETRATVQFTRSVVSDSLQPHGLQHARPPCPSPTSRVYSNSCPLSQWCHPTISSSVVPFSHLQSFPASWSFQMSQFFTSGGQSIGVSASASVLSVNIQDWFPLGWTGIRNCLKITTIIKKDALDYDSKLKSLKKRNQMLFIKAYLKFSLQGPGHHRG